MAHLKPRTAEYVIYQGDDMPRLAELKQAFNLAERALKAKQEQIAETSAPNRLGDALPSADEEQAALEAAQDEFDEFVDEAAERALTVELNDIGRRRFRDLVVEHPPRMVESEPNPENGATKKVVHEDDEGWGVNTETFGRALLTYRDGGRVTIAQPEFPTVAAVCDFVDDELSDGDFQSLWVAALLLNKNGSSDPKARRRSMSPGPSSVAM